MARTLIIAFLSVVFVGCLAYGLGMFDDSTPSQAKGAKAAQRTDWGEPLYPIKPALPAVKPGIRKESYLTIDPCTVTVPVQERQDVATNKDGKLLGVGRFAFNESELPNSPDVRKHVLYMGKPNDGNGKDVSIPDLVVYQIPLKETETVQQGQIVAMIDIAQAYSEVRSQTAKLTYAQEDLEEVKKISQQMDNKLSELQRLASGKTIGVVTSQELADARIGAAKYAGEIGTKTASVEVAKADLAKAWINAKLHFLTVELPGRSIVKKILKGTGDGLKAQEPVLQLWNISRLSIEGSVEAQFSPMLRGLKNAKVIVEPSVVLGPKGEYLNAHRGEVHCMAVLPDGVHFISGGADHTLCVWKRGQYGTEHQLIHKSAVRSVAASPKGMVVAAGCADGSVVLWDLAQKNPEPRVLQGQHTGAVTALAFTPGGEYLASGGEDHAIVLCKTGSGEVLYPFDAEHGVEEPHQGTITSLTFTPQGKLVSAARDNTLRVWSVFAKGVRADGEPIAYRGGQVSQAGVSADGRFMVFDKGQTLQLLNVSDGTTACVLNNVGGPNPFDTLALFSPDGSLMLTGGAGEGRLHLWKTPTGEERGYQVRELVVKDRIAINAAAFGPSGTRFAVTGSADGHVQFWELPGDDEVASHRIFEDANKAPLRLDIIESSLDGNKSRIAVTIQNPLDRAGTERLMPGQRVSLVIVVPNTEK
jgi:WD40 repeat protein